MANPTTRNVNQFGNLKVIYGNLSATTTAQAFTIADTKTTIVFAVLQPVDKMEAQLCAKNSDDGTEDTAMGSLWVDSATSTTVCSYFVLAV